MIELQKTGVKRHIYLPDGSETGKITDVLKTGKIISLVGGGGKTTSMYQLGQEYAAGGYKVIMTTTTHIRPFANDFPPNLSCIGTLEASGKLKGPENPDSLARQCDYLLIEADGSRGFPLKMPADHEPVISPGTETVVAVLGLQAIGQPIIQVCHRWEIVADFLGKRPQDTVTVEDAVRIILSPRGLYKNVGRLAGSNTQSQTGRPADSNMLSQTGRPAGSNMLSQTGRPADSNMLSQTGRPIGSNMLSQSARTFAVILNQADRQQDLENGKKIAALLPETIPCVITSYEKSESVHALTITR